MGLEATDTLTVEMDPDCDPAATQPVKFNPDVVEFVLELGPSICNSVEECRASLSSVGANKLTPTTVARIILGMIKAQDYQQNHGVNSQQQTGSSSIWGGETLNHTTKDIKSGSNDSDGVQWNGKCLVQAVLDIVPNFMWKDVFHELDFPGFYMKDTKAYRSLMETLRYGLQLQGQIRPDQFPVEALYRTWNNTEGQVSLLQHCLNPHNYDLFSFADVPYHSCPVETLKTTGDKSFDSKEISTWKSIDLVELLLNLSEAGHTGSVQDFFQFPIAHCPDILILSLIQLNTPMNKLRQDLLTNLFPVFLNNHVNSGVILQQAWHTNSPTLIKQIMILSMADWYLRSDCDQTKLSRILDIAQDLKALPLLLNANSHVFIIDLACLASRREFLKLDKWLSDKIREHGEQFVGSILKVLNRRVPFLFSKDDSMPKTIQLPQEVIAQMVHALHQYIGKVNGELSETITTVVNSYTSFTSKNRSSVPSSSLPPPIGPGGNQPPPVLRSHRSMEPGFGVSSPTSGPLFPPSQNNDPLTALGSTLAGLNLAGVGNAFGPMHGGGHTPGSPSRVLGPNFNPQQNTNAFPGHGPPNLQLGPPGGPPPLPTNMPGGPNNNMQAPLNHSNPANLVNNRMGNNSGGNSGLPPPPGPGGPGPTSNLTNIQGLFTDIQPGEVSKEAEDEANSYFHRIYSKPPDPTMSTDEVIELLKRFQESPIRREREVFTCMLRNLFEEYKFFPQYPEKELHTTAQLFGGIIEQGLVTTYLQLGVALRFVVDALKKAPGSKMYYFGIAAIDRFRNRLKEYPQYCQHLSTITHFQEFPSHLVEYIEYGARSQEPPRPRSGPGSSVGSQSLPSAPIPVSSSTPIPQKTVASGIAITKPTAAGPSITGRPSIANATNITTLLAATEKDDKVLPPPEIIQDKIAFIFNNLNQMNLVDKCKELKEVIGSDFWNWISQYLVMKRASIELNFHSLYANLLDHLKVEELNFAVLGETHRNIRILLRTDKSAGNFADRSLLKNLGHWLGMITLIKNKPIQFDDLDIKGLIVEAYRRGIQDLLYVVPFAAKVMESCARSLIFKPPSPWTVGILSVLAELHKEPDMKLNLKFEIEVLCKSLNLEIADIKPSSLLKEESGYKIHRTQLSYGPGQQSEKLKIEAASQLPLRGKTPESAIHHPTANSISATDESNRITPSARTPTPNSNQVMGGPVIGGLSAVQLSGAVDPKFAYLDVDTTNLPQHLSNITISSHPLFQQYTFLKPLIRPAVEKAIQDLISPVVDRSIKYTVSACESIVKKDFALDPEETRMRTGAHHMMRYLTAGMAMITSRDHIFIAISTNLKATITTAFLSRGQVSNQTKELIEEGSTQAAQDNMDLACVFIQKTAVEKALLEIDKRLSTDYEIRKQARLEGRRYVDPVALAIQAERVPEQVRIKPGGAVGQQLAVYEDFSRNIPGFIAPVDGEIPFTSTSKFLSQSMRGPLEVSMSGLHIVNAAATSGAIPTLPPPVLPQPQTTGPASGEELLSIYDKLINEMDSYLQGLVLSHSPASATLGNGCRALADMILQAKQSRSVVAAIGLLQKAVEGLLEGLAMFTTDPEIIRFRDAHLMVLKGLQDTRAFGQQWVNRQVTKTLIEARDSLKFNVDAVDTLIRANLVNMLQFDAYLANALEKGNNLVAMNFAMQLVQMYLIDERYSTNVNEGDLYNTVDTLGRCATVNRSHPDGLLQLMEHLRNTHEQPPPATFPADRAPGGASTHLALGITQPREFDDPQGLQEKSELLLREWCRMYSSMGSYRDSSKPFGNFINDLNVSGILKSDEIISRFFRISIQTCVTQVYQALQQGGMVMRYKMYVTTDAFVRLVSLLIRHIGDTTSLTPKINLLNKFLGIVAGLLIQDHELQKTEFQQLPFHRLYIMLFNDLTISDSVCDQISFQMLSGFSNTFHILNPSKVPGFGYAWLEIIGHRSFIAKMLAQASDQKLWAMYCQLLLDLFKFLNPFLRNAELSKSVQHMYRGTLRVLLVILHDFPDFLCDYCYNFLDSIPPNCIQMRNLVLSAFPRNMRLPDPFTANLKFEMLADTAMAPRMLNNATTLLPANFKKDLESYLNTRAPVTFLSELRTNLQVSNEAGTRYNIPLLNSLVLTVGSQHISVIRARGQTPNMATIAHTSHMDIFQNLAVDLDTEGRYLFLNSLANQLRFPSSHTHYFSLVILYLFAQSNTEVVQEQITRVLLERLVVNRPHPWGLLVTFIELIKNSSYKFWSHEFVHCAPEVEKLFESVARSCMVTKNQEECTSIDKLIS